MATEIIINLNDDRDAYVLSDPKDIIHVNELEQVRQLLEASVREAKKYENADKAENSFKRKHDTIMLAGVRGSGKTTFMLSILNFIKKGIDGTTEVTFKFEGRESIEVLNIFDPTLIEDKVHVFINIVSMIKDRVDDRTKKANCFRDIKVTIVRAIKSGKSRSKNWLMDYRLLMVSGMTDFPVTSGRIVNLSWTKVLAGRMPPIIWRGTFTTLSEKA